MKPFDILILLLIVIVFTIIVYRIIEKQYNTGYYSKSIFEGLIGSSISSLSTTAQDVPLNQMCIYASYNSAFDGNIISSEQLLKIISMGSRFLDFELFLKDDTVYVNYSLDSTYTTFENKNSNTVSFNSLLNTISTNAFSSSSTNGKSCPNPGDPLFIHLRIKKMENDTANKIYTKTAEVLKNYTSLTHGSMNGDEYRANKVDGKTKISDIAKRIIVVVDQSVDSKYNENAKDLWNYVNMVSGGSTWQSYVYSELSKQKSEFPKINDDGKTTNVNKLKMVLPDAIINIGNPKNPYDYIMKYGCQTIFYPFYNSTPPMNADSIKMYNNLFSNVAFVTLANALAFIKQNKSEDDGNISYGGSLTTK
jgi:hypothetical protein